MAIWSGILQFKQTHPNIQINAFGSQSKGRCRNDDPQSGSNDQTCRSRCAMLRPIFELPIDYSDWSFPREVKDFLWFFPPVSWTKILAGWSWHLSNLEDLHSHSEMPRGRACLGWWSLNHFFCLAVDILDISWHVEPSNLWFSICSSVLGFDNAQRSIWTFKAGGCWARLVPDSHWMWGNGSGFPAPHVEISAN